MLKDTETLLRQFSWWKGKAVPLGTVVFQSSHPASCVYPIAHKPSTPLGCAEALNVSLGLLGQLEATGNTSHC